MCIVVYGGIIGGILTAWIYCKCTKWNFWKIFDIAMPAVAMAQGFGRIGCLLAGCCYGIELDPANPIGIVFHNSAYAPNDVALLPTQIISSVLDFANCFVLLALSCGAFSGWRRPIVFFFTRSSRPMP